MSSKGKGAWYLTTIRWCPVCLREQRTKERRHDARPAEWGERNVWVQAFDWCEL